MTHQIEPKTLAELRQIDENLTAELCIESDEDNLLSNAVDALRGHPVTWDVPNARKKHPPYAQWYYWRNGEVMTAYTGGLALVITHKGGRKYHVFAVKAAGVGRCIYQPFVRSKQAAA